MNSTKLSAFCDNILEMGWTLAVVITPLFFNVYSSRVFEPDKLTTLRTLALIMAAVWLVKLVEERINGRREIYRLMEELLRQGVGILMLTSDYTEALEMSHRIIVMRRGEIAKEYQRGEATEADILREAIGKVTTNGNGQPAQ